MPPIKKVNKADELFNINGLSIKKGASYKVANKFDGNAPSGFQKERTTKLPSVDVANTIQLPFVVSNRATGEGVFDTGLHKYSPCYKGLDEKLVSEKIKMLEKYLVKPYEEAKGIEGKLSQSNEDFWNNHLVNLWSGRYFNPEDPEDMLDLYISMMAGELCPEGQEGNPKYANADFVIIDKIKERSVKQRKAKSTVSAIGQFYILLKENPQKLIHILRYIGISNVTDKAEEDALTAWFTQWLDTHDRNMEIFENLLEKCEEETFEEVVFLHSKLKRIVETKKGIAKNSVGDYVYNGHALGKDLKHVAQNLVSSPDLAEIKAQILEEFN